MNSISLKLVPATAALILLSAIAGCSKPADEPAAANPALATPVPPGMVRGTVLETMDSGGYTYALLDTAQDQRWVAALQTPVAVGDVVQTDAGMIMTDFTSNTLDRTFDIVYFVGGLQNLSGASEPAPQAAGGMPAGHPDVSGEVAPAATAVAASGIEAYEEGKDIAYVYANKDDLAGNEITLRGRVVKYNPGILGWNFVHIQDGSGDAAAGDNDLIVTTKVETAVGDTVVLTGNVVLDKDFGAGYSYPVLLEDASIATE